MFSLYLAILLKNKESLRNIAKRSLRRDDDSIVCGIVHETLEQKKRA